MNKQILFVKKNGRLVLIAFLLAALTASMAESPGGGRINTTHSPAEAALSTPIRITRLSVSSSGEQGNDYSSSPSISADARYVVFESNATNLVTGDNNHTADIFLKDRQTGVTSLISIASSGAQADGYSYWPTISANGRFIVFTSAATNLVADDTNTLEDIFLRDRLTGITERISVAANGTQANANSGPGAAVSADGRYVVFSSDATNLVEDDTNEAGDIFLRDRQAQTTTRISLGPGNVQADGGSWNPSISDNGRYVAFVSNAANLVPNDTNGTSDVFVYDTIEKTLVRVSLNSEGEQANQYSRSASISADGQYVAFMSRATNLTSADTYYYDQIYVHALQTRETIPVTTTSDGSMMVADSDNPVISSDGRYVAFVSDSKYDGMAGTEIWLRDLQANAAVLITNGRSAYEGSSFRPAINANGNFIVFVSESSTLVPDDTNGVNDVFLRDLTPIVPIKVTYKSVPQSDGWILESGENTNTGQQVDKLSTTVNVGDGVRDRQYRSLLSFNTASLPDHAIVISAYLKLVRQGVVGSNPFTTHGGLLAEIRAGAFGSALALEASDFAAPASPGASIERLLETTPSRYTVNLSDANLAFINKYGVTQFRLRFERDDNDDMEADYLKLYSGNAADIYRPVLTITYYLP